MQTDALTTVLTELLGCRYPILQAGMGGVARSELVTAVSEAGGYGFLGMVREPPALIAAEVAAVRARTKRPFGVNLIPAATDPALFSAQMDLCIALGVHSFCFFWSVDGRAIERAKRTGALVFYQVGSLADALAAEAAGADMVIAQGVEAGGHVRGGVSSLVLLPQVAKALSIPVVGSGGFADGAGLAAALALGAQGIHCGTAFLATQESFAHDLHKQRILAARSEDTVFTDAFAINWPPGSPVRVLASDLTERLGRDLFGHHPDRIPRQAVAEDEGRPLYRYSTDSPLRSSSGALEQLALFAGQVAGALDDLPSAGERIAAMATEARAILSGLSHLAQGQTAQKNLRT